MKSGMMVGFEEYIKTFTTLAVTAEKRGINSVYTVDAGRSATVTAIYSAHTPDKYSLFWTTIILAGRRQLCWPVDLIHSATDSHWRSQCLVNVLRINKSGYI